MRMTASWYRPLGRPNTSSWRAMRARWRAPLGIVAVVDLNERGHDSRVVPTEQVWRCARGRQGQVAPRWPSATLDRRSAQRPRKIRSGRGDVAPVEQGDAPHNTLDSIRPIQVLTSNRDVRLLGTNVARRVQLTRSKLLSGTVAPVQSHRTGNSGTMIDSGLQPIRPSASARLSDAASTLMNASRATFAKSGWS